MGAGNVDWKTDDYKASTGMGVKPRGRYLCMIDHSEMKPTKDKTGKYLEFEFTIMKGDYARHKLWTRLNVHNQSDEAQRIGREQFNALVLAAGLEQVNDSSKLHNKLVVCIVDIEQQEGREDKNRITGFLKPSSDDSKVTRPEAKKGDAQRPAAAKPAEAKKPAGKFDDMEDDIPF